MRGLQAFAVGFLAGATALAGGCSHFGEKSPVEGVDEYAQARVRMAAGDYAGAAGLLKRYLAAKPSSEYRTDALVLLGDCETRLKAYPSAQASYQQAQVNPRTKTVEARAKAGLGDVMMAQELYAEATTHYEDALSVGAEDVNRPKILASSVPSPSGCSRAGPASARYVAAARRICPTSEPRPPVRKTRPPILTAVVALVIPPVLTAEPQTLPPRRLASVEGEATRT